MRSLIFGNDKTIAATVPLEFVVTRGDGGYCAGERGGAAGAHRGRSGDRHGRQRVNRDLEGLGCAADTALGRGDREGHRLRSVGGVGERLAEVAVSVSADSAACGRHIGVGVGPAVGDPIDFRGERGNDVGAATSVVHVVGDVVHRHAVLHRDGEVHRCTQTVADFGRHGNVGDQVVGGIVGGREGDVARTPCCQADGRFVVGPCKVHSIHSGGEVHGLDTVVGIERLVAHLVHHRFGFHD